MIQRLIKTSGLGGASLSLRQISSVHSGHMVYIPYRSHGLHIYRCEGIVCGFDAILLTVEEAQIIVEK
jgi:hypothetical protein